jgi:hypothetical protein
VFLHNFITLITARGYNQLSRWISSKHRNHAASKPFWRLLQIISVLHLECDFYDLADNYFKQLLWQTFLQTNFYLVMAINNITDREKILVAFISVSDI